MTAIILPWYLFAALLATSSGPPEAAAVSPGGFRYAAPGRTMVFPRDHGAHRDFQTEWWYFTGNLEGVSGRPYGFELTFFRVGVEPPSAPRKTAWDLRDLALAHFAVSDLSTGRFRYAEKANRGSRFTAGAAEGTLDVFNEGWSAVAREDGTWRVRARAEEIEIDLVLRSLKPPAIHGVNGISVKGKETGAASHYYSMSRLEARGRIRVGSRTEHCAGLAWMDHEFSTSVLGEDQEGWDWFSLQLDDGTELMLYQMRRDDGSIDPASSGSRIDAGGAVEHLVASDFSIVPRRRWTSPHSGATYPMGWTVRIPRLGIELEVDEAMKDQELVTSASTRITYWEGAVRARGNVAGRPATAVGYVEMTGYAEKLRI